EADALRVSDPDEYLRLARASIAAHVEGMLEYVRRGAYVFDYGNSLRGEAAEGGVTEAFSYPGFVPAYIRPLFCRGVGPFRWAALSGDPADISVIDRTLKELFPDDPLLQRWLELAPERVAYQGLPARICWLGYGDRAKAGMVVVADGTDEMGERLERVLTTDPGTGVLRHADAGYADALDAAAQHELDLPMQRFATEE